MSNNFRVGQKVVCVDDTPSLGYPCWPDEWPRPSRGKIYTVAEVGLVNSVDPTLAPCIHLKELRRPEPFWASRFRPAVDKPASIEVFRKMLVPSEGVNA